MDAYPVNPPLPRMIAALPLLFDRPDISWELTRPVVRKEYEFAKRWVLGDVDAVRRQLRKARLMVALFFFAGAWSTYVWARDLYGVPSARLATLMWCLCPDVLANAAVVAPDTAAAAIGLAACYFYWKWLCRADGAIPWHVGLLVGVALLCKFSWLVLIPLLPVTTIFAAFFEESSENPDQSLMFCLRHGARRMLRLVVAFLLTLIVVNLGYGFEGTGKRLGEFGFRSSRLSSLNADSEEALFNGMAERVPVPLPEQMLRGIDYVSGEFDRGLDSYLLGEWSQRGWWYFYIVAAALKLPLSYLVLILCSFALFLRDVIRGQSRGKKEWFPVVVIVVFLELVSSETGFTHHVRYILPIYGFLFIISSRVLLSCSDRLKMVVSGVVLGSSLLFHAGHIGLAHTHFNILAGGPNEGWRSLGFSNVDWGQSTYRLAEWVNEHESLRPMTVQFRSQYDTPEELLGSDEVSTRVQWVESDSGSGLRPNRPGWYAFSSYRLTHREFAWFWERKPYAQPWPDVIVFRVRPEDLWVD